MCIPTEELHSYLSVTNSEWVRNYSDPKTRVEKFLVPGAGFFPDKLVIPRIVIPASDIDIIEKHLRKGVNAGYSMGIRTVADRPIFGGGKLDWDLEIDTDDKVANFLGNTFPKWKINAQSNNYTITRLILMSNLPEIGTKTEQSNQFVFRVAWNNYSSLRSLGSQLLMEMALGTNNLRTLDKKMEDTHDDTIRYKCSYKETGFLEKTELHIGNNVVNLANEDIILSVISQLNTLIKDPEVQFLRRLEFFADIGLNIVEFQGYTNKAIGISKMLIYGLRGEKDETLTGLNSHNCSL